jgi:glycosyltransferase involved in cell wall biosynthesis
MSYEGVQVALTIPAYRASVSIAAVIADIPPFVDRIIVVDDASDDGTAETVRALDNPRVHLIVHERNKGVGGAMKTAYKAALAQGFDLVVKMDADGQMDPRYVGDLVSPALAGEAGYVKGNRLWSWTSARGMPRERLFGNLFLSLATKAASGYWSVFDPTNGFTAIRADVLRRLDFDAIEDRYYFETNMLVELHLRRVIVQDVLMEARYQGEASSLSVFTASVEFALRLVGSLVRRVALEYFVLDMRPGTLFGVVGTAGVLFGTTFGFYHWRLGEQLGTSSLPGTVMVAAIPVIVGTQLLVQAIALDIVESRSFPRLKPLVAQKGSPGLRS